MPHDNFLIFVVLVPKRGPEEWVFLLGCRLTELASDLVLIVAALDPVCGLFIGGPIRDRRPRIVRLGSVLGTLRSLTGRRLGGADGVAYPSGRAEGFIRGGPDASPRHRLPFFSQDRVELLQRPIERTFRVGHLAVTADLLAVAKEVLIGGIALSLTGIATVLTRGGLAFFAR